MNIEISRSSVAKSDLINLYSISITGIILLFLIYYFQWFDVTGTELAIVYIVIAIRLYQDLLKSRFRSLTFLDEEKKLKIHLKPILGKIEIRTIPFENLYIELNVSKWKIFPTTICFLKDKTQIYALTKSENKISDSDWEKILNTAKSEAIPIIHI
jgi:hypothetical protein